MHIESKVRQFILRDYLFTDDQAALKNDDSFMNGGILDSTGILEMIMFLSEQFGIIVEDDEMVPENLDSVSRVTAYVRRKSATAAA